MDYTTEVISNLPKCDNCRKADSDCDTRLGALACIRCRKKKVACSLTGRQRHSKRRKQKYQSRQSARGGESGVVPAPGLSQILLGSPNTASEHGRMNSGNGGDNLSQVSTTTGNLKLSDVAGSLGYGFECPSWPEVTDQHLGVPGMALTSHSPNPKGDFTFLDTTNLGGGASFTDLRLEVPGTASTTYNLNPNGSADFFDSTGPVPILFNPDGSVDASESYYNNPKMWFHGTHSTDAFGYDSAFGSGFGLELSQEEIDAIWKGISKTPVEDPIWRNTNASYKEETPELDGRTNSAPSTPGFGLEHLAMSYDGSDTDGWTANGLSTQAGIGFAMNGSMDCDLKLPGEGFNWKEGLEGEISGFFDLDSVSTGPHDAGLASSYGWNSLSFTL